MGQYFSSIVIGPQITDLIAIKSLAPYRLFVPPGARLENLRIRAGEFAPEESYRAVSHLTGDVIAHYRRHSDGKQALVFCTSRNHSREVAKKFMDSGITAAHIDGDTDDIVRRLTMEDFRNGNLRVLCNVDLFGEGVDLPAVETLIMLRPTMSTVLYMQQIGRVLRSAHGKIAIILDHVGNSQRHGLPDQLRKWSLAGLPKSKKKNSENQIRVRVCPSCFMAQPPAHKCRFCGKMFETTNRHIEMVDGELVEVQDAPKPWGNEAQLKRMFMSKMPQNMAAAMARKVLTQREANHG